MDVLLTGATGFIGSQLGPLLAARGHRLTVTVRPGSEKAIPRPLSDAAEVLVLDLDEADIRERIPRVPDVCIHLAWEGISGTDRPAESNLDSLRISVALLRSLGEAGCRRFVGVGTCYEYAPSGSALREDDRLAPRTLYGAAKAALFLVGTSYASGKGMEFCWARPFSVYGPGQHPMQFVPSVIVPLIEGRLAEMTAGEQVRDLLHVSDAADALRAVAESGVTGPINVASGTGLLLRDIAGEIAQSIGRPELLRLGARPYRQGDAAVLRADVSRLRALPWAPRLTLRAGLEETIQWWRER